MPETSSCSRSPIAMLLLARLSRARARACRRARAAASSPVGAPASAPLRGRVVRNDPAAGRHLGNGKELHSSDYPNFAGRGGVYAWPTSVSGTSPVYRFNVRRVSLLYDLGEREDLRAAELSQFHARRNRVPRTNESVTRTVFKNKTPRWITGALCVMGA